VKKLSPLVACLVLLSCAGGGMVTSYWNRLPQEILDDIAPSIWGVFDKCGGTLGTAFIVNHEGEKHLVTSLHVLRGFRLDEPLDGQLGFERTEAHGVIGEQTTSSLKMVKVVHTDDILDIAILTAEGIEDLPALKISKLGDQRIRVFAIGLAQAVDYFGMSITEGIISNPDKEVVVGSRAFHQTHIEHTAFLVGGQSGGPLVDMRGRAVGVNSFAKGLGGLHLFYSTPLLRALQGLDAQGQIEIRNNGVARIKEIYVTPIGEKPAEIDKLPHEIGRVNGHLAVRFQIPEGMYRIRLITEEREPTMEEVKVVAGELSIIEYDYKDYGVRIVNNGCKRILMLSLLSPMARDLLAMIMNNPNFNDGQKQEQVLKLMMSQNILGKSGIDSLAPGQTWVEWVLNTEYDIYSFTWDPKIGEFRMPDARKVKIEKGKVVSIYLND
jgi:hypothetical protein